jgi:hypothetical protein
MAPEFVDELRPVQADEGTAASFECRVTGLPAPKVQWFKDGTPVKSGDGITIEALPDGTQRLKLDSAQVEDQGNYRCEACSTIRFAFHIFIKIVKLWLCVKKLVYSVRNIFAGKTMRKTLTVLMVTVLGNKSCRINELQSSAHRIWLVFSSKSSSVSIRMFRFAVAEEMEVDESETAPEFTSPLKRCVADEGTVAALECAVAGHVEKVTWYAHLLYRCYFLYTKCCFFRYKDGKEVKPDNAHVKIESTPDGKQKLTILDAAAGDIGTYKCIVSNKVNIVYM